MPISGMGGGFFGSGASSTEKAGSSANTAITTGDVGGDILNLGPVSNQGKYATTNIDLTLTDYGAIDSAFAFAGEAGQAAYDLAESSLAYGERAQDQAYAFTAGAFQSAIDSANSSRESALMFGGEAMSAALAASTEAQNRAAEQMASARRDVKETASQAIAATQQSQQAALSFGAGAFTEAADQISAAANDSRTFSAEAITYLGSQSDAAIQAVKEATQSDSKDAMDKITIMAGVTAGAIALSTIIPAIFK
jgi:hypothetical protein